MGRQRVHPEHSGTLTARESVQIEEANSSGRQPVVFVHGLWLLASSWERWRRLFEDAGYATVAPGWPDHPDASMRPAAIRTHFARKMVQQVTDHFHDAIQRLTIKPAVVGHSFGGLISQMFAGEGASVTTVAIDPAPFRGVLALPVSSLKSASPVLANPLNARKAVALTFEKFVYGWANALPEDEAQRLYAEYHVAASGVPLFRAAGANLNPFTRRRSIPRTRTADRCLSCPARGTTPSRGRSPTRPTSGRANPASLGSPRVHRAELQSRGEAYAGPSRQNCERCVRGGPC
jgi:pimeloyl-ACP methyl ester carboxylesterase